MKLRMILTRVRTILKVAGGFNERGPNNKNNKKKKTKLKSKKYVKVCIILKYVKSM